MTIPYKILANKLSDMERMKSVKIPTPEERRKQIADRNKDLSDKKIVTESSEKINSLEEMAGYTQKSLHKELISLGWYLDRTKGGHAVYKHNKSNNNLAVPMHSGELARPTVYSILKLAKSINEELNESPSSDNYYAHQSLAGNMRRKSGHYLQNSAGKIISDHHVSSDHALKTFNSMPENNRTGVKIVHIKEDLSENRYEVTVKNMPSLTDKSTHTYHKYDMKDVDNEFHAKSKAKKIHGNTIAKSGSGYSVSEIQKIDESFSIKVSEEGTYASGW